MLKKINFVVLLGFFLCGSVNGTILDQAKWLLQMVESQHLEEVGCCVGNCLVASVDLAIFVFGWLDLLLENRFNRAHASRLKADALVTTKRNLEKLIWFLKKVERTFFYTDKHEITTNFLESNFKIKFAQAVNEMRHPQESISDTIKRIHLLNQAGDDRLKSIDISLDYYSTIRSSFCK